VITQATRKTTRLRTGLDNLPIPTIIFSLTKGVMQLKKRGNVRASKGKLCTVMQQQ